MAVNASNTYFYSSGAISFSSLRTNFKETTSGSISASQLRRDTSTSSTNPVVPNATENSSISASNNWAASQFRNSIKYYIVVQTGTDVNVNFSNSGYWNNNLLKNIKKIIYVNGTVGTNSTSSAAASFSATAYNFLMVVSGGIYGAGGAGGTSSSINGKNGGTALSVNSSITIQINSTANVYGGGGGGEFGSTGGTGDSGTCYIISTYDDYSGCNGCVSCVTAKSTVSGTLYDNYYIRNIDTSNLFPGDLVIHNPENLGYQCVNTNYFGFGSNRCTWQIVYGDTYIPSSTYISTVGNGFVTINQSHGRTSDTNVSLTFYNTYYQSGCSKAGQCACNFGICSQAFKTTCRRDFPYTVAGGPGGQGGNGGPGRGYNNFSGSLSGSGGSAGSGGGCDGYSYSGSPAPQPGQTGETGGSGGNWGSAGAGTNNTGSGGSAGAAISGSNYSVTGSINSNTIKGSY